MLTRYWAGKFASTRAEARNKACLSLVSQSLLTPSRLADLRALLAPSNEQSNHFSCNRSARWDDSTFIPLVDLVLYWSKDDVCLGGPNGLTVFRHSLSCLKLDEDRI